MYCVKPSSELRQYDKQREPLEVFHRILATADVLPEVLCACMQDDW
jgi:hypothetical protein